MSNISLDYIYLYELMHICILSVAKKPNNSNNNNKGIETCPGSQMATASAM